MSAMTAPRCGGDVARAETGLQVEGREQAPGRTDVREQHRPGVQPEVALYDPRTGHRVATHQAPVAEIDGPNAGLQMAPPLKDGGRQGANASRPVRQPSIMLNASNPVRLGERQKQISFQVYPRGEVWVLSVLASAAAGLLVKTPEPEQWSQR